MYAEEVHIRGGAGRRISTLRGQNFLSAAPRAEITCAVRNMLRRFRACCAQRHAQAPCATRGVGGGGV